MGDQKVVGVDDPLRVQPHELTQRLELARVPVSPHFHHLRVAVLNATAPLVRYLPDLVESLVGELLIHLQLQIPQIEVLHV